MSFASRYSSSHFVYPSPFRDPDGFVRCVVDQVQRLKATVLIPVYEETFLIAKHKERFTPHVSLVLPDYSQILIAHNKDRWETIARGLAIPVPPTFSAGELQQGKTSLRDLQYPVLIKPKQLGCAWGIRETSSSAELEHLLTQPPWTGKPWDQFFVQQKISGPTHCVAMPRRLPSTKPPWKRFRNWNKPRGKALGKIDSVGTFLATWASLTL